MEIRKSGTLEEIEAAVSLDTKEYEEGQRINANAKMIDAACKKCNFRENESCLYPHCWRATIESRLFKVELPHQLPYRSANMLSPRKGGVLVSQY